MKEIIEIINERNSQAIFDLIVDRDTFMEMCLISNEMLYDKYFIADNFTLTDVICDLPDLLKLMQQQVDYVEKEEEAENNWDEMSLVNFYRELEIKRYKEFNIEEADYCELTYQDLDY